MSDKFDATNPEFLEKLGSDVAVLKEVVSQLVKVVESQDKEIQENPLANRMVRHGNYQLFQDLKRQLDNTKTV